MFDAIGIHFFEPVLIHENFAAHFEDGRRIPFESPRDGTNRQDILGDVVADGAITAGCSVADFAVFEQDRNGDAIDFWLDHHWNFLMWEQPGDTRVKFG